MQNSVAKKLFAVGSAAALTLAMVAPFAAQAAPHAAGTNVSDSSGTVWMIMPDGTRRAYTSAGAFLSYGFNSWSQVVPASADDLALPAGSFIPPQDGAIICSDRGSDKGTCYEISSSQKYGFTSAAVFTGLGFSFANSMPGDVSWMANGPFLVNSSTQQHLPGTLINNNGTVQLVGTSGLLGIPDLTTFNSWGYSFSKVVPANTADTTGLTQTGVMAARTPGQLSPISNGTTGTTPTPTGSIPSNGGGLSVSLSSQTPAATNVAAGAAFLPFTAVNFAASGNPVVVTTLMVHRSGLGADQNLNNMYLFNGNMMLAQSSSFQNGVVTFTNSAGLFTVPANTTMTVWVKGDLASGTSSGLTYAFGLNSASDITSNASSVSGTFPITGNLITSATVSSPALATLTAATVSTGSSVNAGTQGFLAGQFSLQSANSSVQIKGISLTFVGSASLTSLQNVKLMANGTQVGNTVSSPSTNVIFFDLSGSPLMVPTGNTINLQVIADIAGSANRTNNYFSIQHNYDIQSYDTTYNVGILATSSGNFPVNGTSFNINQGTLTVTRDPSSRTNSVAPGQTNVQLATFDFTANGEDVKIFSLPFSITGDGTNDIVINNVKLVDNSGFGLGTSDTTQRAQIAAYTNSNTGSPTFTQGSNFNYVIPANTTRKISIVADLVNSSLATSTNITAALTAPVSANAQGVQSVAAVTTPAVSGNTLSVSTSLLTATVNSAVANPTLVVPNALGTKIGSFTLNAGGADSVDVTTLGVTATGTPFAADFQNLKVMVGSTQIGQTQTSLTNGQAYSFSPSAAINIPAGGSINVDVFADVLSGATAQTFAPAVTLTAVTAQLHTSGSTATAMYNGAAVAPGNAVPGQTVKITGSGSVTISQSPTTPVSRQLAMSQTGQILGVIKFAETTGNEAATLTDLTITATATPGTPLNAGATASTSANTLLNFTISATDNTGATLGSTFTKGSWTTAATDGTAPVLYTVTFNNINLPIPQGPSKYMNLTVKADINAFTNGAASNSLWTVGLASKTAATIRGASSNSTYTGGNLTLTSNATSNTTTVARTTIGVTAVGSITSPVSVTVNQTGSPGANENMAIFAVTASSAGDAILKTITLSQGGTAPTSANTIYSVYDASQGLSSSVGNVTLTSAAPTAAVTLNLGSAAAAGGVTISAGTTKYLVIQANTTGFNTSSGSSSSKSYSLQATTWTFNDGTSNLGQSGDASSVTAVTSTGVSRSY